MLAIVACTKDLAWLQGVRKVPLQQVHCQSVDLPMPNLAPDLCRLQGWRLWKKSRHIQILKNANDLGGSPFLIYVWTGMTRLSNFPMFFHWSGGSIWFLDFVAMSYRPWQISEAAVRTALAEAQVDNPDMSDPPQPTVFTQYRAHVVHKLCCRCLLDIWNCQRNHHNHHPLHHPSPISAEHTANTSGLVLTGG